MDGQITHLVINWINIEDNVILVGATDNERWRWDTAKSIVYVTLTDNGKSISISEEAGFHCSPGDPTRALAMTNLVELYKIAWMIKNENFDLQTAREKYFGLEINKAYNTM